MKNLSRFPAGPSRFASRGQKACTGSIGTLERYTAEERANIGKQIYEGRYTVSLAAEVYGINFYTARNYLRAYKAHCMTDRDDAAYEADLRKKYERMEKEELIEELVREKCGRTQ